jgi:adenylate cyclase
VCVVLLFALVPLRIADPRPLEEVRLRTFDLFQVLRPREQTARPVVIVDIDEASLKEIGQWPWPRTIVADLVTRITELGAVAIGFDIVFAEPDRMSPAVAERAFAASTRRPAPSSTAFRAMTRFWPMRSNKPRVVVGQAGAAKPAPRPKPKWRCRPGSPFAGPIRARFLVTFPACCATSADRAGGGRPRAVLDQSGARRHHPPRAGRHGSAGRAGAVADHGNAAGRQPSSAILVRTNEAGVQAVAVPGLEVPTDRTASSGSISTSTIRRVTCRPRTCCKAPCRPDRLRGKLVLIGTSATGLLDIKTTPVDPAMPGVEVHAQILESVLTKSLLQSIRIMPSAPNCGRGAVSGSPSSSPRRCCRRRSSSRSARF